MTDKPDYVIELRTIARLIVTPSGQCWLVPRGPASRRRDAQLVLLWCDLRVDTGGHRARPNQCLQPPRFAIDDYAGDDFTLIAAKLKPHCVWI